MLWSGELVWFCPVLQLFMVSTDGGWLTVTMTSVPSKDQQWTSAASTCSPVKTWYKDFPGSDQMMSNIKTWQISRSFQAVWRTDVPTKCALWQSGTWQRVTLLSLVLASQQPTTRFFITETLELLWLSQVRCSQHSASQNHQHECSWSKKINKYAAWFQIFRSTWWAWKVTSTLTRCHVRFSVSWVVGNLTSGTGMGKRFLIRKPFTHKPWTLKTNTAAVSQDTRVHLLQCVSLCVFVIKAFYFKHNFLKPICP